MQPALEVVERDLPDNRVDHVLDLARQQHFPFAGRRRLGQEPPECQHLAEYARRLRKGQRSRGQQLSLPRRQALVHSVSQFMGQSHYVSRLSQVVQHHVGVHVDYRWMGEGAGCLSRRDGRVNPAVPEERLREPGHLWIKIAVGRQYRVTRLLPSDSSVRFHGQWRVPVPDF